MVFGFPSHQCVYKFGDESSRYEYEPIPGSIPNGYFDEHIDFSG